MIELISDSLESYSRKSPYSSNSCLHGLQRGFFRCENFKSPLIKLQNYGECKTFSVASQARLAPRLSGRPASRTLYPEKVLPSQEF